MSNISRFRVRPASKVFTDPGPDLLRDRGNATNQVAQIMGKRLAGWTLITANAQGEQSKPGPRVSKAKALDLVDRWCRDPTTMLLLHHWGKAAIALRYERVQLIPTANCTPGTVLVRSLIEHQFPRAIFSGGYVYKESYSGYWSDHAWGTAVDMTENPPEPTNDETFDWLVRMAQAGCVEYDYALGSQNGHVMKSEKPGYEPMSSDADSGHLWHVHTSVVDHGGSRP